MATVATSVAGGKSAFGEGKVLSQHGTLIGWTYSQAAFDKSHRRAVPASPQGQNCVVTAFPIRTGNKHR